MSDITIKDVDIELLDEQIKALRRVFDRNTCGGTDKKAVRGLLYMLEDWSYKYSMYLDYVNNFLTVSAFAEFYDMSIDEAEALIKEFKEQ